MDSLPLAASGLTSSSSEAEDRSVAAGEAGQVAGGGAAGSRKVEGGAGGWRATASHLCVEDLYDVEYEFNFRAVNLRDWRLGYRVKGPKKDYSISGVYKRP